MAYTHFPLWYQAEKGGFRGFQFCRLPAAGRALPAGRRTAVFAEGAWTARPADDFDWTRDQADLYRYFFVRRATPLPPGYFPAGRCAPVLLKSAGDWSVFENMKCKSPGEAMRYRPGSMRQPFCRWRHGPQTWRVRIMCQRCGSLSGPAIGPASST